jgi:hypothetical protein
MIRLALFVLLLPFLGARPDVTIHRFVVQPASSVEILGRTNVNKFQCISGPYTGKDTLILTAEEHHRTLFHRGKVQLKASGFTCGLRMMTKDFAKTIKADEFPFIEIEFTSFEHTPAYSRTKEEFNSQLNITLANNPVGCQVKCTVVRDEAGLVHLVGSRTFTFAEFNLKPPSRMLGTVKVNEDLIVNFHLVLRKI